MRFSEWIKTQLDALQAMVTGDDEPDGTLTKARTTNKLELKFNSHPANVSPVRKLIEQFCDTAGLDSTAREEVGLVVNEALANVIRHAYAGATDRPIEVTVDRPETGGVRIAIRDWGNGVDPSKADAREHDPLQPGGIGLICLRKLMDQVEYLPQPDGMLLQMTRSTSGSKVAADEDDDDLPEKV